MDIAVKNSSMNLVRNDVAVSNVNVNVSNANVELKQSRLDIEDSKLTLENNIRISNANV